MESTYSQSVSNNLRGAKASDIDTPSDEERKTMVYQYAHAPYDSVATELGFTDEHQQFWWEATASSLGHLLKSCQYTIEDQFNHLRWHHQFIVPFLGPRPIAGVVPKFQPCPVFDGSAVEHSINWKELDPKRTVRFTIEATGFDAGTDVDPFNQDASVALLKNMAKKIPDLDLKQFDVFAQKLFLPSDVAESLIPKIPPGTPLSQIWMAFDLMRGKVMAKVYFMPVLKMLHTDVPTKTLVFDAARACNGHGSFDGPINLLNSYMESLPSQETPVVEMVAIDCIDSPNSRIKIYLRTSVNTLARAKTALILGGRLKGEAVHEGIKALSELWPILFRLDGDDFEHEKIFPDGSYCGNAIEMKPGHDEPEVKLHIPVRKIPGTDAQLCESLSTWFRKRGHGDFAARYEEDLQAAFPQHDLKTTNGTHTFVSFTYTKKTGVYMTMYYSTKILGVHMKHDIWSGYDNMWTTRRGGATEGSPE